MKRELTVAAGAMFAAAIFVGGISACSSDGSSAGGGDSSSAAATTESDAPSTTPVAPTTSPTIAATSTPSESGGPASASVTVDGKDVAVDGPVECRQEYTGFVISAGEDLGEAYVELSDEEPPEASRVRITDAGGAEWYFQAHGTGFGDGEVTVTKSGTSYTITGEIPFAGPQPSAPSKAPDIPRGTLTPFEIDVTCP